MADFVFDTLPANGTASDFSFDDRLLFQSPASTAALVSMHWFQADGAGAFDTQMRTLEGPFAGKSVFLLNADLLVLSSANFSFAGGGAVIIGDNTQFVIQDNQANTLVGSAGSDYFAGLGGNDSMSGGAGDDRFHFFVQGGLGLVYGNDTVNGGDGADWLVFDYFGEEPQQVIVDLGLGFASGGYGSSSVTFSSIEAVSGTQHGDSIAGSAGNDAMRGGGGNDTLAGAGGLDFVHYGDSTAGIIANLGAGTVSDGFGSSDVLSSIEGVLGSAGSDTLLGSTGDDSLTGAAGADSILGGLGSDNLRGSAGVDTLRGGAGADDMRAGQDGDQLFGGSDDDTLAGALGNDNVRGAVGNDDLGGGQDNDTLGGGQNNDRLRGGQGNDDVTGGLGADIFAFANAGSADSDVIHGFLASDGDRIELDSIFFATLAQGTLSAGEFGTEVLYNTGTGALSYDADGAGAGAAVLIATLEGAPALAAGDILVL
jgi:Ca2+-binding RTX toxin-like protein